MAALITRTGVLLEHKAFPADSTGHRMLTTWARSQGPVHKAGVELQARQGFRGQSSHAGHQSAQGRPHHVPADLREQLTPLSNPKLIQASPNRQNPAQAPQPRGGDCQANAALYRIIQSRLRWDSRTQIGALLAEWNDEWTEARRRDLLAKAQLHPIESVTEWPSIHHSNGRDQRGPSWLQGGLRWSGRSRSLRDEIPVTHKWAGTWASSV